MPFPDAPLADPPDSNSGDRAPGWQSKVGHVASHAISRIRIAAVFKPAPHQIMGRQADPLSVSTSYVILRNGIGVLGFSLPIVMVIGGGLDHIQGSLSAYYHFSAERPAQYGAGTMRDPFVGILCAIGAFLFFYRGHSLQEDVALNVAGISAVLVALFPMDWPPDATNAMTTTAKLHSACATAFFVMIAYVCVFRARDTLGLLGDYNRRRSFERIYLLFGILMLATPATVALIEATATTSEPNFKTLIVETAGVFVFAAFWLVKSFEIRTAVRASRTCGQSAQL
jgi:hypothetical protein